MQPAGIVSHGPCSSSGDALIRKAAAGVIFAASHRMTAEQDSIAPTGSTPGAAWRAATWIILAVDVLIAFLLTDLQGQERHTFDIFAAAGFIAAFFALIGMTIIGVGCGIVGAVQAFNHGDKRFVVILPMFAHVVLLIGTLGALSAGR